MKQEEEKYDLWFKKQLNCNLISKDKYNSLTKFQAIDFAMELTDEQVKKALEEIEKEIEDGYGMIERAKTYNEGFDNGLKFALSEIEKSLPSDEDIYQKYPINFDGTRSVEDTYTVTGIIGQRNKTQEVINKLKKP